MPIANQPWDPTFHTRSALFDVYQPLLADWQGRSDWPGSADFEALVERERRLRAPELGALRFCPLPPRPRRARTRPQSLQDLYDGRIALSAEVPCLERSYHDLFNALVFAAYPRAKRALHARQFRALAERLSPWPSRLPAARSREQDALTIFDEGGSLVVLTPGAAARFREHGFLSLELESEAQPLVFGHAVLEHLHARTWGATAALRSSAYLMIVTPALSGPALLDAADAYLGQLLADPSEFTSPGSPAVLLFGEDGSVRLAPGASGYPIDGQASAPK